MYKKIALGLSGLLAADAGRGCPKDMSSLRSSYVANSYDATKLSGFFYEVAYEDIMQKGETCQCFNETIVENGISEEFGFTYKNPGSSSVFFEKTDVPGMYMKYMGSSDTALPTVVVDVTVNADGMYETITEYTCHADGAGPAYEEIKIGARTPTVSTEVMDSIKTALSNVGIQTDSLIYVEQEGCEYAI